MRSILGLAGLVILLAATSAAADPAPAPAGRRDLPMFMPPATLGADEILSRLASADIDQVQEGVGQLWHPPRSTWDDATLRRMVAALADVAHRPIRPMFHGCGTGSELWPRAEYDGIALALLSNGARVPDALILATRHGRPEARLRAIEALDALPSEDARKRYIEMLGDADERVRASAAEALDRLRPCGFQTELTPLLSDASEVVRRRVAVLLATCGRRDAMPVLAAACEGADAWLASPRPPPGMDGSTRPADCAELVHLITHDHASETKHARLQEALAKPQPPPSADGMIHWDLGPPFSWSDWWTAHGDEVSLLKDNVALLLDRQALEEPSPYRSISRALIERTCDEPCLRAIESAPPVVSPIYWGGRGEGVELIRARLAPGKLAATALRDDLAANERGRALELLFSVDRLRARAIQLQLLEGPEIGDVDTALLPARSFPLPSDTVHDVVLSRARRDPRAVTMMMRNRSEARECDIACLVHPDVAEVKLGCTCEDATE